MTLALSDLLRSSTDWCNHDNKREQLIVFNLCTHLRTCFCINVTLKTALIFSEQDYRTHRTLPGCQDLFLLSFRTLFDHSVTPAAVTR